MLIASVLIFVMVMTLLALAWQPATQNRTARGSERLWIAGLGLLFPIAILLSLLAYGLWIGERLLPREGPAVAKVQAEARRWSWTFSYEDASSLRTENVLHIPAGRPVDVAITTADVIHSFWVPRLAGKLDAVPGHVNILRLEADLPGTYLGVSSEFSGRGYDGHAFTVRAHSAEDWLVFLESGE